MERPIVFLQLDGSAGAEIETKHFRPPPHGPEELSRREGACAPRCMGETKQVVPLGSAGGGTHSGVPLQQPPAEIAGESVGVAQETLAGLRHRIRGRLGRRGCAHDGRIGGFFFRRFDRRSFFGGFAGRDPAALVQRERGLGRISSR